MDQNAVEIVKGALTRDMMLAWLKKQDPQTVFRYMDKENCAVAQYVKSLGVAPYVVAGGWSIGIGDTYDEATDMIKAEVIRMPKSIEYSAHSGNFGRVAQMLKSYASGE